MAGTIPRAVLEFVSSEVNGLSADAQARVLAVLESITWTPENIAACREIVIQALTAIMPTYTDAAARAGADLYDAVREAAVGEAVGAVAVSGYDPNATAGAIRAFVQDIVDGKPAEQFNARVLDRVDRDIRRAENVSVAENAAHDPLKPKYARVPTGAETCEFCLMLASRDFSYTSREAASHAHPQCDCRVVQGYKGMDVEGYDPKAYLEIWRKSVELKDSGVPQSQREAILSAMRDRLIPQYAADPSELAGIYQRGLNSAWAEFKRVGKTPDGFDSTVGAFLTDMGEASGASFSAEFKARPDGNEMWAATRLARVCESLRFRYASTERRSPDFIIDGAIVELKTPDSSRKITKRLLGIPDQFSAFPDEPVIGALSTLHLDMETSEVVAIVQRFVDDGTLDKAFVIPRDDDPIAVKR